MALRGTYATWYDNPVYAREPAVDSVLFRSLDAGANMVTPAALLTAVATGADRQLAFAILGSDNLVHVVHRVLRYVPPLGQPRMPYDNINLATFGDASALGVTTIEIPATFFARTAPLPRTRSIASINAAVVENPAAGQLELDLEVPGLELGEVRTRKATLLPSSMVGGILRASIAVGGLTPRALWVDYVTTLRPELLIDYAPFVDWVRVAYASGVGDANPVQSAPTPPPRHLEPDLAHQRLTLFTQDLPIAGAHLPDNGNLLAAAIGEFRADLAAREESKVLRGALKRAADQRPSSRWFANTARLLRLCQVQDEADLPPVWLAMASHGVKLDRHTIQYHLSLDMPPLDAISTPGTASICSPELSKALGQLVFQTVAEEIQSGLHIFAVCYPTQASRSKANQVAGLYDEKVQSITGMTMDETVTLKAAQAFSLPVGYVELQLVCSGYHRFLATILGLEHPVVTAMGHFVTGLKNDVPALHPYFDANVSRTTGMLRYIQLSMYSWVKRQILSDLPLQPPNFAGIFEKIEQQLWVIPSLPPHYCVSPHLENVPANVTAAASTYRGTTIITPSHHLDNLVPVNEVFDPKQFIRDHGDPPRNDNGGAMCLLYHVRGQCKQECERGPTQGVKSDHRRHNKAESERLLNYLNEK